LVTSFLAMSSEVQAVFAGGGGFCAKVNIASARINTCTHVECGPK
jgi:hypothetical protein